MLKEKKAMFDIQQQKTILLFVLETYLLDGQTNNRPMNKENQNDTCIEKSNKITSNT